MTQNLIPWVMALVITLVAACMDVKYRRIPNVLTAPFFLGGLAFHAFLSIGASLPSATGGALFLALPFVILFVFAGGGAGDAKLMAGVGAWLGFNLSVVVLCFVALAGMCCAFALALKRRQFIDTLKRVYQAGCSFMVLCFSPARPSLDQPLMGVDRNMTKMPYGIPIFLGLLSALIWDML